MHFVAVNPRGLEITDVLRAHFLPLAFQSWQQMFAGRPFSPLSQRCYASWEWRPGEPIRRVRGERLPVLVEAAAAADSGIAPGLAEAMPKSTAPGSARDLPFASARRSSPTAAWLIPAIGVTFLAQMWISGLLARSRRTSPASVAAAASQTRHAPTPWRFTRVEIAGTPVSLEVVTRDATPSAVPQAQHALPRTGTRPLTPPVPRCATPATDPALRIPPSASTIQPMLAQAEASDRTAAAFRTPLQGEHRIARPGPRDRVQFRPGTETRDG